MKALLMIAVLACSVFSQERQKLIGEIEFFGYAGIDLNKLKAVLPVREGDEFRIGKSGELAKITMQVETSIKKAIRHPATEIAPVCCDRQGNWMIYIGLSGKTLHYRPEPKGKVELPAPIINLYDRFGVALKDAISRGAAEEDHSAGYALSTDPAVRQAQLEMRAYALEHEALLLDVLQNSSDSRNRIAAAEILGYARQSGQQIAALAQAARDVDGTVRNNATRALWVLVESKPELAKNIPPDFFVDQLMSGKWTDLNKASLFLSSITAARNEKALSLLRQKEVRTRLIEMVRWRTFHADAAAYLLGRIAGIDEERLHQFVAERKMEEIIKAATSESKN